AHQTELPVDLGKLKIVHADDLRAVRVDDLLVEQVARESQRLRRQRRGWCAVETAPEAEVTDLRGELGPPDGLLAGGCREDRPLGGGKLALRHQGDIRELPHL